MGVLQPPVVGVASHAVRLARSDQGRLFCSTLRQGSFPVATTIIGPGLMDRIMAKAGKRFRTVFRLNTNLTEILRV